MKWIRTKGNCKRVELLNFLYLQVYQFIYRKSMRKNLYFLFNIKDYLNFNSRSNFERVSRRSMKHVFVVFENQTMLDTLMNFTQTSLSTAYDQYRTLEFISKIFRFKLTKMRLVDISEQYKKQRKFNPRVFLFNDM